MSALQSLVRDYQEVRLGFSFEMKKNVKGTKLFTVFSLAAGLSLLFILIPLMTGTSYPSNSFTFLSNVMGFTGLIYVLFALFLGADSINREQSEKTDLILYPLPQRRSNVILSKFFAQLLSSWLAIGLYYLILVVSVISIYGVEELPSEILNSFLFSLLYMMTLLSFAFFLSSVISSPATSMTLTFFGIQILLPLLIFLLGQADLDLGWIFTNYSSYISSTLGISGGGFGPSGLTEVGDYSESLFNLTSQGIALFFVSLFFGTRKEVGA